MSKRRNARGSSSGNAKSAAMLAGASVFVLALVGGGGWLTFSSITEEKLDVAYCYDRGEDQHVAAMWVDFSHTSADNVSNSQDRDLLNIVRREYASLPVNGKLYVFTTASDIASSVPEPEFVICRPARTVEEQASIGAPSKLFTVLRKESDDAQALFDEQLGALMRDARDEEMAALSSPIISQFRGISNVDFGAPLNHFIAFTDAIENSASNGHFCVDEGALRPFEEYAQRSDYNQVRLNNLDGVEVDFFMVQFGRLPNDAMPYCDGYQALYDFYTGLFEDAGADGVRIEPLGFGAG